MHVYYVKFDIYVIGRLCVCVCVYFRENSLQEFDVDCKSRRVKNDLSFNYVNANRCVLARLVNYSKIRSPVINEGGI